MGNIEEDKERYAALAAAAKERNQPKRTKWFESYSTRPIRATWENMLTVDAPPAAPTLADWERELLEPEPMGYDLGRDPSLRPPSQGTEFCVCGCGLPVGAGGVSATPPSAARPTRNVRPGMAAQPGVDRYEPSGPALDMIRSVTRTREEMDNLNRTLNRQIELRYAYDARLISPPSGFIDPIQRG